MRGLHLVETRHARALRKDAISAKSRLWQILRNRKLKTFKFARQFPIGPYLLTLLVEVDGKRGQR